MAGDIPAARRADDTGLWERPGAYIGLPACELLHAVTVFTLDRGDLPIAGQTERLVNMERCQPPPPF